MSRKARIETREAAPVHPPAEVEKPDALPAPVSPPATPEPVKRNIFNQIIKPIVGGIGSGNAK